MIDLARVASMIVVIIFHTLLWQVLFVDGQIRVTPWAPGPIWWAVSWVCTIIPVFFVAAGYSNAVVVDKWRATQTSYAGFLTLRGSKLLGPMTLFMLAFASVGSLASWFGWSSEASALSRQFAQLLWFAVTYLILLAAAPAVVWAHDRWHGWEMLLPLVGLIAIDAVVRASGHLEWQWVNLIFVWALVHQLGVAYNRGWFRTWARPVLVGALIAGVVAIIALIYVLGYPAAAVAWADIPVANLLPPTLAITVLGFCQTVVMALLDTAGVADNLRPNTARAVTVANAMLLTVYLWHIGVIVLVAATLAGLTLLWPQAAGFFLNPFLLLIGVLAGVAALAPGLARLEYRLIPDHGVGTPRPTLTVVAYSMFVGGTWAVWQNGALLSVSDPWAGFALLWFLSGVWLLRRATIRTSG